MSALSSVIHKESRVLVVFLRPICNQSATSLHRNCCLGASPGFCQIAIWRSMAREWRGANRRPSDGKIKAAACGTVGRQNRTNRSGSWRSVRESMTACGFAQLIEQSRLCAPCVFRLKLRQARSHDRLARRCRTAADPSRLALCATGAAGFAALTGLHRARLLGHHVVMASCERDRARMTAVR
jgi:hypothetical protein